MKYLFLPYLLLLTGAAQAQVKLSVGPRVGYTLSSASFTVSDYPDYFTTSGSYSSGFEAGIVAQVAFAKHLALQPAVLYSRLAPYVGIATYYAPNNYRSQQDYHFQFNYLSLPLNLLYSQRPQGQGAQVLVGAYLGLLLGGKYSSSTSSGYGYTTSGGRSFSGDVAVGDTYATNYRDTNYYSRQLDAGVQAGLGYGLKALQLQASFSYGLRNIGADYAAGAAHDYEAPVIHNYGFHLSAAYLFGPQ